MARAAQRRHISTILLLLANSLEVHAYYGGTALEQDRLAVEEAGEICAKEVPSGASGPDFIACLEKRLSREVTNRGPLTELVRNFSCAQDDVGTLPVRTAQITVQTGYDACEAAEAVPAVIPETGVSEVHENFDYLPGVLPAGNDLAGSETMSAREATEICDANPDCAAFTFSGKSATGPGGVFFKSTSDGFSPHKDWHSYRKKDAPQTCAARFDVLEELRSLHVDIIREEPLVAVVRSFATTEECDKLIEAGGDWGTMGRAYTSAGKPSQERRSYSSNIYPPLKKPENEITKLTALMFTVTRNLTGYKVYPPGQEPVNAVLYKNKGDEYRPHCDGSCSGGMHRLGERIATSILYCRAAEKGGQTSFTQGALKVKPGNGDLLLFAYRYPNGRMTGEEAQHSGCPIREGKKWIATQWYREGVSEVWNWESANQLRRSYR